MSTLHQGCADGGSGQRNEYPPPAEKRNNTKVSLKRYRMGSAEVMSVIMRHTPPKHFERASIDEVYLDLTGQVDRFEADGDVQAAFAEIRADSATKILPGPWMDAHTAGMDGDTAEMDGDHEQGTADDSCTSCDAAPCQASVAASRFDLPIDADAAIVAAGTTDATIPTLTPTHTLTAAAATTATTTAATTTAAAVTAATAFDHLLRSAVGRRLLIGAAIVRKVRAAVLEETTFSMSAGLATNKVTSKIASARHKPNMQTVVSPEAGR
jgi:nucleotidyltransferase/DNA polymerase involved in DNA repair